MLQARVEAMDLAGAIPQPAVKRKPEAMLHSRQAHLADTAVRVGHVAVGNGGFAVIAGPCSVESPAQMLTTAQAVAGSGAALLRGGAFKPRTSPYSFQGMGLEGLRLLAKARQLTGLPVVTEVMDTAEVDMVAEHADMLQVGARNVQNFSLLKRVGRSGKPVLLKRGLMNTISEFLMAAEYILAEGNPDVILCERGIRTFETATRNTLDLSAVCVLKEKTHLPVIVDPSHAAGRRAYVRPLTMAALAVGADGVMVEVHCDPDTALCDGDQSLKPEEFAAMMTEVGALAEHLHRPLEVGRC